MLPIKPLRSAQYSPPTATALSSPRRARLTRGQPVPVTSSYQQPSRYSMAVPPGQMNFSHRIDQLSFAQGDIGANTLDGTVQTSEHADMRYQYYLRVVPTATQACASARRFPQGG